MFTNHERPEWAQQRGPGGPHQHRGEPGGPRRGARRRGGPFGGMDFGPPFGGPFGPGGPRGRGRGWGRGPEDEGPGRRRRRPGARRGPGSRPVGSGWTARSPRRPGWSRTRPRRSWSRPWRSGSSLARRRPPRHPRAAARGAPPRLPDHPGDRRAFGRFLEAQPGIGLPDRLPAGRRGPGPHREGVRPHGRAPDRGGPHVHRGARRRARRGVVAGRGGCRRRVRPDSAPRAAGWPARSRRSPRSAAPSRSRRRRASSTRPGASSTCCSPRSTRPRRRAAARPRTAGRRTRSTRPRDRRPRRHTGATSPSPDVTRRSYAHPWPAGERCPPRAAPRSRRSGQRCTRDRPGPAPRPAPARTAPGRARSPVGKMGE